MGINKKSRTAKVIAGFVGFATAVTMSLGTASAQTAADLQAQIASLLATINSLQAQLNAQTGGTTTGAGYTFATNLTVGSKGTDVMNLQKVLNMDPATQVASTGAGSPGMETTTFGPATKAAVIKFQNKHAADILTPLGLTSGTGFVGASMRAYLNSHYGSTPTTPTTPTTPVGTTFGVTLSADTPAAGTLISGSTVALGGQAVADLAHFTFSNPTSAPVAVTNLVFNRTGVSNDTTLSNVYLYNGVNRLTDSATVSSAKITFNDASGLFTVPAGATMTISVKADIAGATSGQVIGVALASATAGATAVTGTYPIAGNNHTIATATMAGVSFGTTPTPATAGTPDLQTGYTMWSDTISVTTRAVNMKYVTFRQLGSATTKDLSTFQLFLDGKQVGVTIATVDANGYLTFDLSAAPLKIETGSHTLKLVGDIIGGSTRTFSFSLQQAGDASFIDSQLGVAIVPQKNNTTFASLNAPTTGSHTINSTTGGTLTVTKTTDSPSGNIINNGSNLVLAKYTLKATGEPLKVEKVRARVQQTGQTSTDYALRNGSLFANGVQVGSTASINEADNTTLAYTEFSLGSSLVVYPGTPVTLEVRADVYNTSTTAADAIASADTITVDVTVPASGYKKMSSLNYNDTAISNVAGNTLTVAVGALTGSKNASYANQTTVIPQTAYKIGSFTINSDSSEAINLDTISVDLSTGSGIGASEISDLYVVYGGKTSTVKGSPVITSAGNDFSINETLAANATMSIDVYATLTSDVDVADTTIAKVTVTGTTANSATSATTNAMTGQTISYSTGTISAAAISDSSTAIKLLVGNTTPKVASFRFTATNDSYSLTDIGFSVASSQNGGSNVAAGAIRNLVLKSSGMTDKIVTMVGNNATSSGLTLNVPANDSNGRVVDVYMNLNDVSASAATSSANVILTLANFKANSSTGTTYESGLQTAAGTNQYVFKSIPTITLAPLPSTLLTAGTLTLSKFTISADAAGPIGWKQILFTVAKSSTIDLGATTSMHLYDSTGAEVLGTFATTSGSVVGDGTYGFAYQSATSGTISFQATTEQQITTSQTYSLKDTVFGSATAGKYVSVSIANPSTYTAPNTFSSKAGTFGVSSNATFVWTDRSSNSHSESTPDWNNDYKVLSLPLDTQTLTGSG